MENNKTVWKGGGGGKRKNPEKFKRKIQKTGKNFLRIIRA